MAVSVSEEAKKLAQKISADEASDIYLYNGPINENALGAIIGDLSHQHDSAMLILATHGGSANSAYRIARFFHSFYTKFAVLTFSYCKSAGTLLALGAHRFIMADFAELGPLDVQLNKRDEIWERRSGLLLRSALTSLNDHTESLFNHMLLSIKTNSRGSVRFRLASELAAQMVVGLLSPVYEQIAPEGLGEDYQELMVAYEYGKRLGAAGGLVSEASVNRLVHNYPSHDFVIDKLEARTIFSEVEDPSADMYALASKLGPLAFAPDSTEVVVQALSKVDEPEKKADEKADEKTATSEESKSPIASGGDKPETPAA